MTVRDVLPILALTACSSAVEDTEVTLPEDTGMPEADTSEPFVPEDPGTDDLDIEPLDTLHVRQWGTVSLSPVGGPYTSASGTLFVQEYVNGAVPPDPEDPLTDPDDVFELACDLEYVLAGVPSDESCPGCAFAFEVQFSLISGDRSQCHDPFLPLNASAWTLGWHGDRSSLLRDMGDTGSWLSWYPGELADDAVAFEWLAVLGYAMEEEDDR